jgi:hypothetical protein
VPAALLTAACLSCLVDAAAANPAFAPSNLVIDGPSPAIVGLDGLSIARDGTGALVYEKRVGGVDHVFVSRLLGGAFGFPRQVDAGLAGPSSQPVIAAGRNGLVLVAFINGGTLYVVESPGTAGYSAPAALIGGAGNPAISINDFGKAYLAFTVLGAGGHDVRAAYFVNGRWGLESAPLDAAPGDDAGSGTARPAVVAGGDGIGIAAWGESGHIYSRRLSATSPSVAVEQADVPSMGGAPETSADQPSVGAGGDSSFATVAFEEHFSVEGTVQSRVLSRRLHGSQYDGISQPDGLSTPSTASAQDPMAAVNEYGRGFVTSARVSTHQLFASPLSTTDVAFAPSRVDSLQNTADPHAVPAIAGLKSTMIAWQQTPGSAGPAEVRARYAQDGLDLGAQLVASDPGLGPVDAANGLYADGDGSGDAAIAWAQGGPGSLAVVVARLLQPPGGFSPSKSFRYANSANPLLSWSPAGERWGSLRYVVTVDGTTQAITSGTRVRFPVALTNGSHSWRVTAFNDADQTVTDRAARVFVDTVAPHVTLKAPATRRLGQSVKATVSDTDSPPPLPRGETSGIASAQLKWGDGTSLKLGPARTHLHFYSRAGRYTLTMIVKDRAGNRTTITRRIRILPAQKAKHRRKKRKR